MYTSGAHINPPFVTVVTHNIDVCTNRGRRKAHVRTLYLTRQRKKDACHGGIKSVVLNSHFEHKNIDILILFMTIQY